MEENIRYIFKKQLEEADILVLNKVDMITAEELEFIDHIISAEYPARKILHQNSMNPRDIGRWLQEIERFEIDNPRISLDIDYDRYADGEAQLAWLDRSISIQSARPDAAAIAISLTRDIYKQIQQQKMVIGHLKFIIESGNWAGKISYTMTDYDLGIAGNAPHATQSRLLINARVQTDPGRLKHLVEDVLKKATGIHHCQIEEGKSSAFSPGYPKPEYRIGG